MQTIKISDRITWVVADPTESIIPANYEMKIAEWILKTHLPELPKLPKREPKPEPAPKPLPTTWERYFDKKDYKPPLDIPWGTIGIVAFVVVAVLGAFLYAGFLFGLLVIASGLNSICVSA